MIKEVLVMKGRDHSLTEDQTAVMGILTPDCLQMDTCGWTDIRQQFRQRDQTDVSLSDRRRNHNDLPALLVRAVLDRRESAEKPGNPWELGDSVLWVRDNSPNPLRL